jgi:hypothetical protein
MYLIRTRSRFDNRSARRAICWLVVGALAFAWSGATLAQAAPKQPPAKKAASAFDPFSAEPSGKQHPAKKAASEYSGSTAVAPGKQKIEAEGKGGRTYGTTTIVGGLGQFPATLDQALALALETSPKVMAAKARVTLAEAELSSVQMDVARKIVQLWAERQTRQLFYEEKLEANRKTPGSFPAPFLIEAGAAVTQVEMELRCLIGQASASASRSVRQNVTLNVGSNRPSAFQRPAKPLQLPRGTVVEKIRQALLAPTQVEFVEASLPEVMDYLKDKHKIEIQFDAKALNDAGVSTDMPITINLKGITLGDLFQSWDDREPELKFVIRNYGILVTTPERAHEQGYFPVVDLARLAAGRDGAFEIRTIRVPNGETHTVTEQRAVEPAPPQLELEAPATRGSNPVYQTSPMTPPKPIRDEEPPTVRPSTR